MTPEHEKAFMQLHAGLPRQAPGSNESTLRLLEMANMPSASSKVLDIGCGPGRASLLLAKSGFDVTAIDTHEGFLDELRNSAIAQNVENLIITQKVSMFEMPYSDSSFDLIWSEGSAYIAGWNSALQSWQRLLKPSGKMVLTECCWLTENPSTAARAFWQEGYPTMMTVEQAIMRANERGLAVEGTFTLPDSDWWDEYYVPLEKRLTDNRRSADEIMQEVIAMEQEEIELRKKHGSEYGYVGFILSLRSRYSI